MIQRILYFIIILSIAAPPLQAAHHIVLDPGHGGDQDGAISPYGVKEKDVVLDIAKRIARSLKQNQNYRISLTREKDRDVDLVQRVLMSNIRKADLFISIHANALPRRRKISGIEVYFLSLRPSSTYAAQLAQRENRWKKSQQKIQAKGDLHQILHDLQLNSAHHASSTFAQILLKQVSRYTKADALGIHQAPFVVLTGAKMPAVLIEVGYIDHPREARKLNRPSYREKIAQGMVTAIKQFFNQKQQSNSLSYNMQW